MNYAKGLLSLFAVGFACLASAAPIKVADVQVRADDSYGIDPTDAVLAMCSVRAGMQAEQEMIQNAISEDVKTLMATPNYSNVEAAIGLNEANEWVVVYTITRRPQLAAEPAITGLDGSIRMGKARDAVKLKSNEKIDDAIAAAAAGRLKAELEKDGYVDAVVDYEIRYADNPGYAFLTFMVTPGLERNIREYTFEGNTIFDHDELAGAFGWRPIWNPVRWFQDLPLSDEKLDDARAVVNGVYTDAGYLDAEVAKVELVQREGEKEGRVNANFHVNEGQLYSIGTITVDGATIYPKASLEAAGQQVILENGAVATRETLTKVREAIEEYYGSRGYVDTYATPTLVARIDAPIVDITYKLHEGEQARIRNIEIRGNSITQDKVIRRELALQPGELYDSRLIKRSEARIRNLQYFQDENGVTSYTVKTANAGERDLVFNVREKRTMQTHLGVGISTVDNIFVSASVTQTNFDLWNPSNGFRGGGQRASAAVEFGSRRQTLDVSWTQPWLFDMPLSFTVNGYRRMRWFDHYDEIRTGAAFTLSWKPMPIATPFGDLQLDRLGVRYTIEQVKYDDADEGTWYTADGNKPFRFTDQDDGINSKLRFFWSEEHRNRPFFPTAGWNSMFYVDVGVGGDAKDYGLGFTVSKYFNPWKDHTVMARFRFDTVEAYSGDVPMFDRFFIGGGRTVRGFEFRDGGPKAYQHANRSGDHVAIGGQSLWCGTLEYSIPIVEVLSFAIFTDIGMVGNDFCDFGDDLLWSAGCGLRLNLPGFPIRLDVAKPITNDDDTEEEVFTFSIGIVD